jgi:diaminopimelate epimerase
MRLTDASPSQLPFVKMHGLGNDYIYLDAFTREDVEQMVSSRGWGEFVGRISDRHKGIGSDGVILVCRPRDRMNHARMRMFNADGTEAEMCGNGVRCVAKFAHDRLGVRDNPVRVETGRGVLNIRYAAAAGRLIDATVDMLEPSFAFAAPRSNPPDGATRGESAAETEQALERLAEIDGRRFSGVFVSTGNPHAVFFLNGPSGAGNRLAFTGERGGQALAELDLARWGPRLEKHDAFGGSVNVHVVEVDSRREVRMRTWERGSGITQACGTGACAVVAAGVRAGRLDRDVLVHLPGGELRVDWDATTNHLFMTGPAEDICEGTWLGATPREHSP